MMTDPYAVLGLSPGASDDEVKSAYRRLAKKYHPDVNQNDKQAEQRMKEINEAYDLIMRKKAGGAQSQGAWQRDYSSYSNYSGGSAQYAGVRSYINAGRYYEAIHMLSEIQLRTSEWYFLYALANAGLGNRIDALRYAQQAVQMEPQNEEYRQLLMQLQSYGRTYQTNAGSYGFTRAAPGAGICLSLCILRMFCPFCC